MLATLNEEFIYQNGEFVEYSAQSLADFIDCCCICVCECEGLEEIFQSSVNSLTLTVTDDNQPQQVTSNPDPVVLAETASPSGCHTWEATFELSCELGNVTATVRCDASSVTLLLVPENEQAGCMLTNIRVDSLECDNGFEVVFKADVAPNPNGPDPPTCVAPCSGTEVTFTIVGTGA